MPKTKAEWDKTVPKRNGWYYLNLQDKIHKLPAVTEILQVLNKPALISWAAKESTKIALDDPSLSEAEVLSKFYSIRNKAGERGKRIHSLYHAILKGTEVQPIEEDKGYYQALTNFKNEYAPKLIAEEKIVYSLKYGYAGTLDQLIETKNLGLMIIDLKTSKNIYPEMGLQLQAYKTAIEEMEGIKINKTAILQVSEEGTFMLAEMNEPLEIFLSLQKIWIWQNKGREVKSG